MTNVNKYYHPKFELASELISVLYNLEECITGGLCHIVTDDGNIYDDDLDSIIKNCDKEENKNEIDRELSKTICIILKQMTFEQRAVLFEMIDYGIFNEINQEDVDWFIDKCIGGEENIIKRINSYKWR